MESTLQEKSELVLVHAEGLSQADSYEKFHCRHPKKPMVNKEQCQIVEVNESFHANKSVVD
jgi:hypothetical protein